MKCWRDSWLGAASTLFIELLHISNNALRYFAEPLNLRGIMVQLEIEASDSHALFTTLLCLTANFAMTPRAASSSPRTPTGFWGLNPKTVQAVVLRPKPSNRSEKRICYASSALSTRVTVVLDRPITKSSSVSAWLGQPPSWLGQHGQLLLMCSCLLMPLSVSHHD